MEVGFAQFTQNTFFHFIPDIRTNLFFLRARCVYNLSFAWDYEVSRDECEKSEDRKNVKFKCRDHLLLFSLSLSSSPPSFTSSFSLELLWFVLTVDWIVDRVKWNQCNGETKWKPSTGSPDHGCALSWNPRICSTRENRRKSLENPHRRKQKRLAVCK